MLPTYLSMNDVIFLIYIYYTFKLYIQRAALPMWQPVACGSKQVFLADANDPYIF